MKRHENAVASQKPHSELTLGGDNTEICLRIGHIRGKKAADIRRWCRDKNTGELKPSSNGLIMLIHNFSLFLDLLDKNRAEITRFIGLEKHKFKNANTKSSAPQGNSVAPIKLQAQAMPREMLWSYEVRGAARSLTLNSIHPIADRIMEHAESRVTVGFIEAVAASLSLVPEQDEMNGQDFIDLFMSNLSSRLRRAAEGL